MWPTRKKCLGGGGEFSYAKTARINECTNTLKIYELPRCDYITKTGNSGI